MVLEVVLVLFCDVEGVLPEAARGRRSEEGGGGGEKREGANS